jgi:hypothetical protein
MADMVVHVIDNAATINASANSAAKIRPNYCRGVVLHVNAASAPTGTSPTLDMVLQSSMDGTNWADAATVPQFTASGVKRVEVRVAGEMQWRVKKTIGGTASPTFTNVTTSLIFLK